MTNMKVSGNGNNVKKDLDATNQMKKFTPGDIVWTMSRSGSWWPCQTVDEGRVIFKPKKKVKDGLLVRMYGCYEYLYVDPVKCNSEFEKILKQDNLTIREAFQKAIDEDLSRIRSGSKSKRKATDSKEGTKKQPKKDGAKAKVADNKKDRTSVGKNVNPNTEGTKKQPKKDGAKSKAADNKKDSTSVGKNMNSKNPKSSTQTKSLCTESTELLTPDPSERRTKVMQRMGLIAPVGSPYQPSGSALSSLLKKN